MDLLIIRILFVGTGDEESGSSLLESLYNTQKDATKKKGRFKFINSEVAADKPFPS